MEQYNVTGMSCAACSSRVEKAVSKVPGVSTCSVSLLTNSMGVEGSASPDSIIAAVEEAGYGASLKGASDTRNASASHAAEEDALKDKETPVLKKRLIASIGFLAVLMYFSMGHMMWGWPLPSWFEGNHVAMGLLQMILAAIVMVINQKFFISGFKSLWHRAPNMDTLVALGSMASFVWSVIALFLMTDAQLHGDMEGVMRYMDEFYFESAAMILTLITVGKMLEARSKGKTTDALKSLMKLIPWCGGGAFLDGVDMRNIKDRQLWRKMAYVPQKSTSVPYSVLDMVLIGRNPYKSLFAQPDSNDRKMAEAALERVGMLEFSEYSYDKLSAGQQQLVKLARALVASPSLLIMDEPESGLDLRHTAQLIKLIKELCKTDNKQVLFITHRPEHALMIADKTLLFLPDNELLHTSFVLWGDTKNILCQENLEQAYGISFAIEEYGRKENICQEKRQPYL